MNISMLTRALLIASAILLNACGGGGGSGTSSSGSVNLSPSSQNSNSPGSGSSDSSSVVPVTPVSSNPNVSIPVTEQAAIRFLEQASFGPTTEEIQRVMHLGFSGYIDEQFTLPESVYVDPLVSDKVESVKQRFLYNAMNSQDQLRQRMAFALGQIFVFSVFKIVNVDAITSYQRMLLQNAFGNYAELLRDVTLHPSMGVYLDMVNNSASDNPNENYAREVMQLFSIGMVELNDDATVKLDALGESIPAYTQAEVEGVARALTGWTFPTMPGHTPVNRNPWYFYGPMEAVEALHDQGEKTVLDGVVLSPGQTAEADLSAVLNAISTHPNVAPFICLRLIQHFVTSNPSGAYVQRIASVFNNNGNGVRGDLKAVIKAILLDREARRGDDINVAQNTATPDGRLKDPVVFVTSLLRSLSASSTGESLRNYTWDMGQNVFTAPSVFNFYPADYVIPGTQFLGPEFAIYMNPYIVGRDNFVNTVILGSAIGLSIDFSTWAAMAGDVNALVDAINLRLFHGGMKDATRAIIVDTVETLSADDLLGRAKAALYLAATSPEYFVHH